MASATYRGMLIGPSRLLTAPSIARHGFVQRRSLTQRPNRDPFVTLGVSRQATPVEIKLAYYELMKKHHPDSGGTTEANKAAYTSVSEAYELLRDETTRKALASIPSSSPRTRVSEEARYHKPPNPFASPAGFTSAFADGSRPSQSEERDYYERLMAAAIAREAARRGRPMSDFAGSSYTTAPPRYGYGLHPNDPRMHAHFYHGSMPGGPETAWQRRQATRADRARLRNLENQRRRSRGRGRRKQEERSVGDGV